MTLGEIVAVLRRYDSGKVVSNGFQHPHSYRGYYDEVAFNPAFGVTVGDMLDAISEAIESGPFIGWKGGEFYYNKNTPAHIAYAGECSMEGEDEITIEWLLKMLEDDS